MGISIGLLVLLFGAWYYFLRVPPQTTASPVAEKTMGEGNVVDDIEGYTSILDGGNLENQLSLLVRLDEWPREAATPIRLDTLKKRLDLAQAVARHDDLTEEQRIANAKRILNAMGQIYGIAHLEKIDSDGKLVSDYLNICNSFVNDPDPEVSREARLSKLKALVYEASEGELDGRAATINENFMELIRLYPNNESVASTVKLLALKMASADVESGKLLIKKVIEQYDLQPVTNQGVSGQLSTLKDEVLLGESGIAGLAREAAATNNYDKYLPKLYELAERSDTGMEMINRIYNAVGFFEIRRKHDVAISILERLEASAENRQDPRVRDQALRVAKWGLLRNRAVGKPFDLSDIESDGNPVDLVQFSDRPVLLVFYSPNNPKTPALLKDLDDIYDLIGRTGIRIVTIAVEQPRSDSIPNKLNTAWVNIESRPPPGRTSEIFLRCPVSHVPYFVAINHAGELDTLNVPEANIKTVVENMATRRATANSN